MRDERKGIMWKVEKQAEGIGGVWKKDMSNLKVSRWEQ
jgi:hypothetical protein